MSDLNAAPRHLLAISLCAALAACAGDDNSTSESSTAATDSTTSASSVEASTAGPSSTGSATTESTVTSSTASSDSTASTSDPTVEPTTSTSSSTTTESSTTSGDVEPIDWNRGFINNSTLTVDQVAVGPDGAVAIAGYHFGATDFGDGQLEAEGFFDMYLVLFDAAGELLWQRALSTGITPKATDTMQIGVSVASDGDIVLTGPFETPTDFGSGPLTPDDATDAFVARYAPDGELRWVTALRGPGMDIGTHAIVDANGDTIATGGFEVTLEAGETLTNVDPERQDIYLVKLDGDGVPLWAQSFGTSLGEHGHELAVAPDGDIILHAEAYGSLDLGGGEVEIPCCQWSDFVARYTSDGVFKWATVLGASSQYVEPDGLAVAPDGSIYAISAEFDLSKLSPDGALQWSHALAGVASYGVAARPEGGVWITGHVHDEAAIDFGDGVPETVAARSATLVAYDAGGAVVDKRFFQGLDDGEPRGMPGYGIAIGDDGSVITTYGVDFTTFVTADFGLGDVQGAGFLVHRAPGF